MELSSASSATLHGLSSEFWNCCLTLRAAMAAAAWRADCGGDGTVVSGLPLETRS